MTKVRIEVSLGLEFSFYLFFFSYVPPSDLR